MTVREVREDFDYDTYYSVPMLLRRESIRSAFAFVLSWGGFLSSSWNGCPRLPRSSHASMGVTVRVCSYLCVCVCVPDFTPPLSSKCCTYGGF